MKQNTKSLGLLIYLEALRPKQWTKNLVVFAAPLFAFSLNTPSVLNALLAFSLFCSASSGFYLLNDIADVESDRRHPVKCNRPIAAGLVSIPVAIIIALILIGGAVVVGWLRVPLLGATLLSYAILQVSYNLKLKHAPILDIVAISIGFILRACAGAAATKLPVSPWFLLCTSMLALFLGIEKRKAELQLLAVRGGKTRSVLKRYTLPLLTRMESTVTTGAFMSYALWSSGPVVGGASTPWMLLTLPFVLYGIFRYQLLSDYQAIDYKMMDHSLKQSSKTERPELVLLTDFPLLGTVVGWVLLCFVILSLKHQGIIH